NNFDLGGLITILSGRVVPIDSRATGKAELVFTGTDLDTATGSVDAKLSGAAPAGSDLTPVSGDLAITADHGQFQIQRANLQTTAGGAQFALVIPRTGENNTSIDATLDRVNAANLIAALPKKEWRDQLGDTQSDVSGTLKIIGIPKSMSGVADLRFGQGRLGGE